MPGRQFSAGTGYRYGFNGKENDNEVKGEGNQQDYGMRIYDPRVGKFLSVDPLTKKYAHYTPYQFAGNKPIEATDLDGAKEYYKAQMSKLKRDAELRLVVAEKLKQEAAYNNETILAADMYGNGHIGPRYIVKSNIAAIRQNYVNAVGDNIRGGPGGAIGYLVAGDKGSFYGAVGDNVVFSFGGIQGKSSVLSKPSFEPVPEVATNIKSGTTQASTSELSRTIINTARFSSSPTLAQKRTTSVASESIVRSRLTGQLKPDEMLMEKPRFYIMKDGKETFTTPDFAIYNTKTNQFVSIPDAKNGGASLTTNQGILNSQGGEFRGSSRYPQAKAQKVDAGLVKQEKTSLPYN